jgi:hypothetical protein
MSGLMVSVANRSQKAFYIPTWLAASWRMDCISRLGKQKVLDCSIPVGSHEHNAMIYMRWSCSSCERKDCKTLSNAVVCQVSYRESYRLSSDCGSIMYYCTAIPMRKPEILRRLDLRDSMDVDGVEKSLVTQAVLAV